MQPTPPENIDVLKYQKSLIEWLRQYPQFTDYDFEGTNFSVLISLLAKNAYDMAHYQQMVGNEAWVDTAELRQSQVSHATDLNYLPRSMTSAQAVITVEIFPTDTPTSIVLPRYYKFKSTDVNSRTIYFVTDQDYVAARDVDGRYIFRDVKVYQGEVTEEYFLASGITIENGYTLYPYPFVISSENIDIKSLEVFVKPTATSDTITQYTYARTLEETTDTSHTFFLRAIYDNQYAIEFGDGVFGAPISNGNQIIARYRNTLGPVIQGNYTLTKTTDVQGYGNIVITSATRVQGGFDRETVEQLRNNAPRFFQTQNRAVTSTDYEVLIKSNFPNIQQVSVYGGEEVQHYGKVFIVLKPFGTQGIVSNAIKSQIVEYLKTKNIVPEPIIVDPIYYYIGIEGDVFYNGDIVKISQNQLMTNLTTALIALNADSINGIGDFNKTIHQSMINDVIEHADPSVTGSYVKMDLRYRWRPGLNINETLTLNIENPLRKSLDGAYRTGDDYTFTTSTFQIFFSEQIMNVCIQDDGVGRIFFYAEQGDGTKLRIGQPIGTIDYDAGIIKLTANILSYAEYIQFFIKLAKQSFQIKHQSFAVIDGLGINLELKRQ